MQLESLLNKEKDKEILPIGPAGSNEGASAAVSSALSAARVSLGNGKASFSHDSVLLLHFDELK